jgi:ubiquitin-protein ligase E3 C
MRGSYAGDDNVLIQLSRLLITFFSPRRQDDVARLIHLSSRISADGSKQFVAKQDAQLQLVRLANITLEALQV